MILNLFAIPLLLEKKNTNSFRFLAQISHTSEWMWKIYFNWIAVILVTNVIVAPIILYYLMINGNLPADDFWRPIPFVWVIQLTFQFAVIYQKNLLIVFSLPWNQTTMYGYFGELGMVVSDTTGFMLVNGTFLLLFVAICMHHQAFLKVFKTVIAKSNQSINTNGKQSTARFLCKLIRFHLSVKK